MRTRVLAAVAVVVLLGCVLPAWAGKGQMRAQFGVPYSMPTDDLAEAGETLKLDDAFGLQASFEYMLTEKVGIEPGFSFANHDVRVTDAAVPDFDLGEIDFLALTGNVNFRLMQTEKMELYAGPTIGFVFWGDLETDLFGSPETFAAEDDFTYGANVGLGVPFGKGKWAFSAALTYLFTEVTLEGSGATEPDLGVDPVRLNLGASYRF